MKWIWTYPRVCVSGATNTFSIHTQQLLSPGKCIEFATLVPPSWNELVPAFSRCTENGVSRSVCNIGTRVLILTASLPGRQSGYR